MKNRQSKEKRFWEKFANKYDLFIAKTQFKTYQSINIVIASNVLHLLYQPGIALFEVKRVLKKDGVFIAHLIT